MSVIPSISSGSQEFWSSSAVENLLVAATAQTSKAIESSEEKEKKGKNLGESFPAPSFSLGLSQDDSQSSQPAASVDVKDVVIDAVPVTIVPFADTTPGPYAPLGKEKEGKKSPVWP